MLVTRSAIGALSFFAPAQQPILPGRPPCDAPSFPGPHFAVGNSPVAVAAGDLDGDGDEDLVTANEGSDNFTVLLGRGDGTFDSTTSTNLGIDPSALALGDLDGDGDQDLAISNSGSSGVSVLLNQGSGTFATHATYGTGGGPGFVAIGDLDGGGDEDLGVANSWPYSGPYSISASVLSNQGDGTFAPHVPYWAELSPYAVAIGDLDNDGSNDMAVANYDSDSVSVLLNRCP